MTPRQETILLVLAATAALIVFCMAPHWGLRVSGRPGIADNERMLNDNDARIVGDSNVIPDPVSRRALANTRFGCLPGMPPLRQVSRGRPVVAQINSEATS